MHKQAVRRCQAPVKPRGGHITSKCKPQFSAHCVRAAIRLQRALRSKSLPFLPIMTFALRSAALQIRTGSIFKGRCPQIASIHVDADHPERYAGNAHSIQQI